MRNRALALSVLIAGCGAQPVPQTQIDDAKLVAPELAEAADRACPWPAGLDQYAETAPAGPDRDAPAIGAGTFDAMPRGCAVVTFAVDDTGIVRDVQVIGENPPGFGQLATKVLRTYNYATGANSLTNFVVRIAVRVLPRGEALLQMTFKDRIINVIVPR